MEYKILSWNIWFDCYFDQVKKFLSDSKADIIGLQEVVLDDKSREVIGFLKDLGYEYIFAPGFKVKKDGRTVGNAIFSKHKIIHSETLNYPNDSQTRNAIRADIQIGDHTLAVFNTHLLHVHQQPSEIQTQQARDLIAILPKENVILMGDFNATPESEVIQLISKALINTDPAFTPTWSVYPDAGCAVCKDLKLDIRLDYIYTSKGIKFKQFTAGDSKGSDHLPILIQISI